MGRAGVLYGVGVGPGDPELLTKKAERILRESDIIAVPDKKSGDKTALSIVASIVQDKPCMYCYTPMIRDKAVLNACYEDIAGNIVKELAQGKSVAFITLGDPSIYSTYMYVHQKVRQRGYEAQMVPGVPSFCAVAAKLGTSLCEGNQRLLIVPASHSVDDCMEIPANKVFMKAGRDLAQLKGKLAAKGRLSNAAMVSNCGLPGERVEQTISMDDSDAGYFSIVVVKED